jgi:hypothetical protein
MVDIQYNLSPDLTKKPVSIDKPKMITTAKTITKKKPTLKKPTKKEEFFIPLNNNNELRRDLLESTKTILESMKLFQEIKQIRLAKNELKSKLKKQLKKINSNMNRIKSLMPKVNISIEEIDNSESVSEEKVPAKEIVSKPQKIKIIQSEPVRPKTEIDRIEDELAEIEKKLSNF